MCRKTKIDDLFEVYNITNEKMIDLGFKCSIYNIMIDWFSDDYGLTEYDKKILLRVLVTTDNLNDEVIFECIKNKLEFNMIWVYQTRFYDELLTLLNWKFDIVKEISRMLANLVIDLKIRL